ncbi:tubulin-like protein [Serratia phage vB_SmaS-Totoro]|nr:tubulin-like protein [Serratia phage vB_SmaS-Totoro]
MQTRNSVSIYGCGGAGIDLVNRLLGQDLSGLAYVNAAFVDSSKSNFNGRYDPKTCYVLEGVDGSGKERSVNYPLIARAVDDVLLSHKPSDLNILVFSASGGTGSVFALKIAEALWAQNKAVLMFVVGSTESGKTTGNTLDTIYSIDSMARKQNVSSVMYYDTNGNNVRNAEVDLNMLMGMRWVLDLYSGTHHGLDSADVLNWARPSAGAKVNPQLCLLDITEDRNEALEIESPISVAELHGDDYRSEGTIPADYNAYGNRVEAGKGSIYFSIYTHGLDSLMGELKTIREDYDRRKASREKLTSSVMKNNNQSEDDGMFFS